MVVRDWVLGLMNEVVGCGLEKSGEMNGEDAVWLVTLVENAGWVVDKTVRIEAGSRTSEVIKDGSGKKGQGRENCFHFCRVHVTVCI